MNHNEQISTFFKRHEKDVSDLGDCYVYQVNNTIHPAQPSPFIRRNYYKIALLLDGEAMVNYADRAVSVKRGAVIFSNPMIPYAWNCISEKKHYYFCLFTESFINSRVKQESPKESALFKVNGDHILFAEEQVIQKMSNLFEMMIEEISGDYIYKNGVLRNHLQLLLHEAVKISQPINSYINTSSAALITELFTQLLSRQFPITSVHDRIRINTPSVFAEHLSIHVNHLNSSVKTITGKSTSELIAFHIINEAKTLLIHMNWNVSEIGYCLGFSHASNFNTFFRKMTGETPHNFRRHR